MKNIYFLDTHSADYSQNLWQWLIVSSSRASYVGLWPEQVHRSPYPEGLPLGWMLCCCHLNNSEWSLNKGVHILVLHWVPQIMKPVLIFYIEFWPFLFAHHQCSKCYWQILINGSSHCPHLRKVRDTYVPPWTWENMLIFPRVQGGEVSSTMI